MTRLPRHAMISWIPAKKGGRSVPPAGPAYMTVARFEGDPTWPTDAWTLNVKFIETYQGGQYTFADVAFLVDEAPHHVIDTDARFELYEGRKMVATGVVLPAEAPKPRDASEFREALLV
jgi:hypothetical protein